MFEWKEEYALGIEGIDGQHKKLFSIGFKLNELMISRQDADNFLEIMDAINDMLSYSTYHFEDEEKFMKSLKYPHFTEHMKEHNRLIDYFNDVDFSKIDHSQIEVIEEMVSFLDKWIADHILVTDYKIHDYIKSHT